MAVGDLAESDSFLLFRPQRRMNYCIVTNWGINQRWLSNEKLLNQVYL